MLNRKKYFFTVLVIFMLCTACTNLFNQPVQTPLDLTNFTENSVNVVIQLSRDLNGQFYISAEFIPADGFHLYSKDIPLSGVDGLGRPTLLTLPETSQLTSAGELTESVQAQIPDFEPKGLLVYPLGAVTLSMPVNLPAGDTWLQESVFVTFMACNDSGCKPPVMQKEVIVQIPSLGLVEEN